MNFKKVAVKQLKKNNVIVKIDDIKIEHIINENENLYKCSVEIEGTQYFVVFDYIKKELLYTIFIDDRGHGVLVDGDKKYQIYQLSHKK